MYIFPKKIRFYQLQELYICEFFLTVFVTFLFFVYSLLASIDYLLLCAGAKLQIGGF